MNAKEIEAVFQPQSIAVIGASSDPMKFGGRTYMTVKGRLDGEKLYAVNPNISDINGEKAYARVQDIPGDIEHAIVSVPAPFVVQAIRDCAEKGVRAVQILAAGFTETGVDEGKLWEEQIAEIAGQNGMRIVGPNCFGVYSPDGPLTILPGPDFPKETGPLGLLAQSGGFAGNLVRKVLELGIRFSKAVSYGNACDVNEIDLLTYFRDDPETKFIAAYMEGVKKGNQFFELVRETTPQKPVIIWKGGLSNQGGRAVASHTASLAGSREIWDGFFRQTGAIPAIGVNGVIDLIVGFYCQPDFCAEHVSVIGGGGAITVAAADALEKEGLSILPFSPEIEYIKAADALGIPTVAVVLSWDNLTTKGTFHIIPDTTFVWNDALAEEATILHDIPHDKILITGAPVFDFWFEMKPKLDYASFCDIVGINADQPFVLYLCSSKYISGDETAFVKEFAKALGGGEGTHRLKVLVRPHPLNSEIWNGIEDESIAVWPRSAFWVDTPQAKQDYYHSIYQNHEKLRNLEKSVLVKN